MIIAIDYDKTIDAAPYPFTGIPVPYAIESIKKLKNKGHTLILNTCRHGKILERAVKFLMENDIIFDFVNENIPRVIKIFGDSRKIYANMYIDDKNFSDPKINMMVRKSRKVRKGSRIIKVVDWKKIMQGMEK